MAVIGYLIALISYQFMASLRIIVFDIECGEEAWFKQLYNTGFTHEHIKAVIKVIFDNYDTLDKIGSQTLP